MDQMETTTSRLLRQLEDRPDLASLLGSVLNYPVRDIPTVEDLEREQGLLGLPTERHENRQTGQDVLDWLTQAVGIAGLLRGSAAGRQQELMGKQRGIETFGKEMMDTSRRAQPRRWREMNAEDVAASQDPNKGALRQDAIREGYRDRFISPGRSPQVQAGTKPPADAVYPAELSGLRGEREVLQSSVHPAHRTSYVVGKPVNLPEGEEAQYFVRKTLGGSEVMLRYGDRAFYVSRHLDVGEALAKARQLANRLDLAAKDLQRAGWFVDSDAVPMGERQIRLPWEPGTSKPITLPFPGDRDVGFWRETIFQPGPGRWGEP